MRRTLDFRRGRWREESEQKPMFVTGWPDAFRSASGYNAGVAFDLEDGKATSLDANAARDRRAELYHHPIGFLQAVGADGTRLEAAREADTVDLVTAGGERFTLILDRTRKLPLRILSKTYEPALGDVTVTTEFAEYIDVGGLRVPSHVTKRIDERIVADQRFTKATVNAANAGALEAPAEVRTPPAPKSARVTVEEPAPGVWYLAGEGHHSVVIELADRLLLVEAPEGDTRALAVIAKARSLRPDKPLTHVVNTHHHFDHVGGIRAAISEGLTVIAHEDNRAFLEAMSVRPSAVVVDALARHSRPLALETVAASAPKVVGDGSRRVEIHAMVGSAHCAAMLMVYLPAERLLIEADAYQPPPLSGPPPVVHPFAKNLLENIETRGLRVDRVLPLHGRIVPFSDLVAAAR